MTCANTAVNLNIVVFHWNRSFPFRSLKVGAYDLQLEFVGPLVFFMVHCSIWTQNQRVKTAVVTHRWRESQWFPAFTLRGGIFSGIFLGWFFFFFQPPVGIRGNSSRIPLEARFQCIQAHLDALIPRSASRTCLNRNQHRLSSTQMAECIIDSVGAEKKLGVRLRYFNSISLLHCTMVPEKRLSTANLVSVHVHGIDQKTADTYWATNFLENLSPIDRQCEAKTMWWTSENVFTRSNQTRSLKSVYVPLT